jgi:hypothetical protein
LENEEENEENVRSESVKQKEPISLKCKEARYL